MNRVGYPLGWPSLVLASLALVPWVISYFFMGGGGPDDSHITFYVARELATTGEYINYNGEAVEQSSSMGFVLLLTAFHLLTGMPIPSLGYVLSMIGGSAAVVLTYALTKRLLVDSAVQKGAGLFAAAIAATSWCLLCWSPSAMETSLAAAAAPALALAMDRYEELPERKLRVGLFALVLVLFVTLRPENVVVSVCIAMTLGVLSIHQPGRPWWRSALWLLAAPLCLTLVRLIAFDAVMPHPVSAKSGGFEWLGGVAYVWDSITATNAALYLAAFLALIFTAVRFARGELRPLLAVVSALFFAELAFAVVVGGDWMGHGRFLVPALSLTCGLVAYFLANLHGGRYFWVLGLVLLAGVVQSSNSLAARRLNMISFRDAAAISKHYPSLYTRFAATELASRSHLRDAPVVVDLDLWMTKLADRIGGPIVLTSGQAGMVPYYASEEHEIRFVDLWGLTTGSVQSCAPDAVAGRYTRGTLVRLDWVLSGRLAERCGLPQPHIVHSELFNASAALLLRSRGYRIVYIQEGAPKGKAFAKEKGFGGYLAIRKDLLTTSEAEAGPTRFDWR